MESPKQAPSDPIEKIAWYLDEAFRIPGTRFRVGWDALIGLVPGVGEAIMLLVQAALVFLAVSRERVPAVVAARMIFNVLVDSLVGSIPLVGDVFDTFFKASTRNIALVRQVRHQRATLGKVSTARHYGFLVGVAAALALVVAGCLALIFFLARALLLWVQTASPSGAWI
jgi:hypothetical protein